MKRLNLLLISSMFWLILSACILPSTSNEVTVTVDLPTPMPTSTLAVVDDLPTPAEPPAGATPTAVPDTTALLGLVEAEMPPNSVDGLEVLPLHVPIAQRPLWALYSQGYRNLDIVPTPSHFVALYTWENGRWQEIARQQLNDSESGIGPDYMFEQSVNQVDFAPNNIWLVVDGGIGAHAGTFQLLRFDGTTIHIEQEASNSSQGVGYLEDVNGDGAPELIVRQHDYYVFCYACGVRYLSFGVHSWDNASQQLLQHIIQPLPPAQQSHPAYESNNRAVEFASTDLWLDALTQIEEAERLAAAATVPTDDFILEWNAALIRLHDQAYRTELNHSPYPLLTNIFYGDYAAVLDIMRGYSSEQLFSTAPPVIQDTVAAGNEQWLADYILRQTNAALSAQAELLPATTAAAYFFRAWGSYLVNPANPEIAADLQQAALLNPDEPLFSQVAAAAPNRIQFEPGATAAWITGQLQPEGIDVYVLSAGAGQQMSVMLTAPDDGARITVRDAAGEFVYGQITADLWRGELPQDGEYLVRVIGGDTAVAYTLQVIIPQRISFAPGAISATLEGDMAARTSDDYILAAQAGQMMDVAIQSPGNNVLLTIVGADGIPLTNGLMSGGTTWRGELPATQDYTIRAIGTESAATYTLTVTIE